MPVITASFFIVDRFGWDGKFEKENVTIHKITLHERFQITDI